VQLLTHPRSGPTRGRAREGAGGLVRDGVTRLAVSPDERLQAGDQLVVAGEPWRLIGLLGRFSDRIVIEAGPASSACRRLGLPSDYLQRRVTAPRPRPAAG